MASNLQLNLQTVQSLVEKLAGQTGRRVELLVVSKTQPAEVIRTAFAAGQRAFAESYVQEALVKIPQLADLPIDWHFIGPIQSNKTRSIAEHFSWVHSVDREKTARRLSAGRSGAAVPLNVCVQVNISAEESKSGVAPLAAEALCHAVADLPNLRLRGLMTVGQAGLGQAAQRQQFVAMKGLFDRINASGLTMDTLSMGMSEDMRAAILQGATMVRVGTAIFGTRAKALNHRDAEPLGRTT